MDKFIKWAAALCCMMAVTLFTACSDDNTPSATDPLPFPMDEKKDLSVDPGNDFFQYCNGSWLAKQGDVASGAIGGMYDSKPVMDQRVEELRKSDPTIGRFFDMMENMYAQPEASQAYIDAHKAQIKKPTSYEEAFHAIGEMAMDGMSPINEFELIYVDGKLMGMLRPDGANVTFPLANEKIDVEMLTKVTSSKSPVLKQIVEGMGLDPEMVYTHKDWLPYYESLGKKSLDDLYKLLIRPWNECRIFVSESALDDFKGKVTADDVQLIARLMINYPLSYALAKKYIPESTKQRYVDKVNAIHAALKKRIEAVDWMCETTKASAMEKIDKMLLFVCYPDKWYDEGLPDISGCQTFVEMYHVLSRSKVQLRKVLMGTQELFNENLLSSATGSDGKPMSKDLTLVNAFYQPTQNAIFMYPYLMLPPMSKENVTEAYEYALLTVVGHEMTHGFDNNGAEYDAVGNMHNWWTVADKMAFEDRQAKMIGCYNNLEFDPDEMPGYYGYGQRTLSENIADLGGFLACQDAYKAQLKAEGYSGENYKAQLRKFYESYADLWCVKYGPDKLNVLINSDVHSPARIRVNGVVMNTDIWYDLYGITRNHKLYLPKDRRTYIW